MNCASDLVQQRLAERGVASMVYYPVPLHLQPLYASLGGKPGDFRVSERASREVLSIPLYPELTRAADRARGAEVASMRRCSRLRYAVAILSQSDFRFLRSTWRRQEKSDSLKPVDYVKPVSNVQKLIADYAVAATARR